MQNPRWANKKNQENPRSNFYTFPYNFWKKLTFPGKKPTFPEKNSFLSAKNSDDLFFSHQLSNFCSPIFKFSPFSGQNLPTEFLEIRCFQQKTLKYMYFLVK